MNPERVCWYVKEENCVLRRKIKVGTHRDGLSLSVNLTSVVGGKWQVLRKNFLLKISF